MSRAERLLALLQALRRRRRPVAGKALAEELGISLRSLYRDIASLQGQGAPIEGEPGIGYLLRPGFNLPPLMFTPDEAEALALGARWVATRTDARLGSAAADALAKIAAVVPADLRSEIDSSTLLVPRSAALPAETVDLAAIRLAIRRHQKLDIGYRDASAAATHRTIWPFALGFFDSMRMLAAWCELRQDFRHFRTERIFALTVTGERYPRHRQDLLAEWRRRQGLAQAPD